MYLHSASLALVFPANQYKIILRKFGGEVILVRGESTTQKVIASHSLLFYVRIRDQTRDFLTEVVKKPATLAGNSLGGFTSLYTAATDECKPMVNGVILMNGAGRFRDSAPIEEKETNQFVESIKTAIQRLIIGASFIITKQPARIEQILRQVYPQNDKNVDSELVESIRYPSLDPNAAEVFYRVITKNGSGPSVYVDDLLENLECPLLLCWGEYDPWIRPQAADKVQAVYPKAQRVSIDAGHCPHDEAPGAVNDAIKAFMENSVKA